MQECLSGMRIKKWDWILKQEILNTIHQFNHTHEGCIGNLCTEEIKKQMQKVIDSFPFKKVEKALADLLG